MRLENKSKKRCCATDKGYSAISNQYYYGCKLHLVTSVNGVFHSMDLTKASVHGVNVLKEIKYGKMSNTILIGDKGYLFKEVKTFFLQKLLPHRCFRNLQEKVKSAQLNILSLINTDKNIPIIKPFKLP